MREQQVTRCGLVRIARWLTTNTSLAPSAYECHLLTDYARGLLSLEQMLELVEYGPQAALAAAHREEHRQVVKKPQPGRPGLLRSVSSRVEEPTLGLRQ